MASSNARGSEKAKELIKEVDIKFPLLIGDKYTNLAYYFTAKLGGSEACGILASIEENFAKLVFFDDKELATTF